MICTYPYSKKRRAMTLIEILVVVAIIAVMLGLSAAAYFAFTRNAPINNTQTRIQGVYEIFAAQRDKVVADAKKERLWPGALALAGGDPRRAKVIMIKARLTEAFPMSYNEVKNPLVYNPALYPPIGLIPPRSRKYVEAYKKLLPSSGNNPATESSACLFMALRKGGSSEQASLLEKYAKDTDNDGLPELVDDWKRPLHFFRFPTENTGLQQSVPSTGGSQAAFRDPLDPEGTLLNNKWYSSANRPVFEQLFHPIRPNSSSPAYYTVPTIVSAGTDGNLGLGSPKMNVTNAGQDSDNIYSFRLSVGGGSK